MDLFHPIPIREARGVLDWDLDSRLVLFNEAFEPSAKGLDFVRQAVGLAAKILGPIKLVVLEGVTDSGLVPLYYTN